MLRDDNTEVQFAESTDYEETDLRSIIEGDRRYRDEESFGNFGYQKQEFKDAELVSVEEEEEEETEETEAEADGIDDSLEEFDDAEFEESDEE